MTRHTVSEADVAFQRAFEAGAVQPREFDHRAHLRLAYVYLVRGGLADAERAMRQSLLAFLDLHRIPPAKFHETLTRAWVMAVWHFMNRRGSASFDEFAAHSRPLLDSKVMLVHYSAETLFSAGARSAFVQPDLAAIPV